MITFLLNGEEKTFKGDENLSLLTYLRDYEGVTSVKDGCSGEGACGACMLEMNGKPTLSCITPMKKVRGARIVTIEGFEGQARRTLGLAFAKKGAVQCGFCTPGIMSSARILLENNPEPNREEIVHALRHNLCRCTGYVKIVDAIQFAAEALRKNREIKLEKPGRIGARLPKYGAYERAVGSSHFVDDLRYENMLYAALKFSDYPRARVKKIDVSRAERLPGVVRVFTADDIPGERIGGLIVKDWPMMIRQGETTRYIGDVVAGLVAETEIIARNAIDLIVVDYEELEPVTDMLVAETSPITVHDSGNILDVCRIQRGDDPNAVLKKSAYVVEATYKTQRVEHGFLEPETALAVPWNEDGIQVYVQSQGVYEDQRQLADILGIPMEKVNVTLVPSGGAFGGKEDLTVQGHAALFGYDLKRPVKLRLNRAESLRMHPKRHPFQMTYRLGCDERGKLTALKASIIGDTGAYASVGAEVLRRAASHATGAYHVPHLDIVSKAVYTNNIPCGAMRGFGVNQVTFAVESAIDELCEKGDFDRWQFRYDNALVNGAQTAAGQILRGGVGVRATLDAVKDEFYKAKFAGLACGIKNCGIGNGIVEDCEVKIEVKSETHVVLHHGWTEMGQGIDTVAQQILCEETGITDPDTIEVKVSTQYSAHAGMTTASRGTTLLGNAIIEAAKEFKEDLKTRSLGDLAGRCYRGRWVCDWTTGPGEPGEAVTHFAYGYATHVVVLNDRGEVDKVYAAHDAGRIINPTLFEGQIHGAVVMGLGYALTEELPLDKGCLKSSRFSRLGLLHASAVPEIIVRGVEVKDPCGPYGAKGIGEIGAVPTAPAVANALYQFDKKRRYILPLKRMKV